MLSLVPSHVDELRRKVSEGAVPSASPSDFSLGAVLELACTREFFAQRRSSAGLALIDSWRRTNETVELAIGLLGGGRHPAVAPLSSPSIEMFPVRSPDALDGTNWQLYGDRFRRSLVGAGFGAQMAAGLAAAMVEMADNIVAHSGPDDEHPAPGLVAYQVGHRWMTYSAVDLGRGVLASLREHPAWSHLNNSIAALHAAILRSASRRTQWNRGDGFANALRSLADLQGHLRFRSGDANLILDGRLSDRRIIDESSEPMFGLQLTVSCALDSETKIAAVPKKYPT